jgi:hypothetical protein
MTINRLSGRERGEENMAKVRRYLAGLKVAGQMVPLENGHPNITAIAEASGVLRNVFYTNAGVKRLLAEFIGHPQGSTRPAAGPAHIERQLEVRDRRILQLEQQLASRKAETEELRKRLAATEQKRARYEVLEEEIIKAGKRVIP